MVTIQKIEPFKLNIKKSSSKDFFSLSSKYSRSNSVSIDSYYSSFTDIYDSLESSPLSNRHDISEEDLEFLMANTGFSEKQIKHWFSEFQKKCTTDFISYEQFKVYYNTLLPNYLTDNSKETLIKKLFSLFDIDWDGKLNFCEFLISFWIRCKAPVEEKFTWVFNMIDSDRNGSLSYIELRTALNLCLNLDDLDNFLQELNRDRKILAESVFFSSDDSDHSNEDITNQFKKYSLFSKTSDLVSDKLNEIIYLLDLISKNRDAKSNEYASFYSDPSISSSFTSISTRLDSSLKSFNCDKSKNSQLGKIQIRRDSFLYLCSRYMLFRKMLIPIKYFFEPDLDDKFENL